MAKRTNSPRSKKASITARQTAEYRHPEETPARPDVGTQPQFKKRAAPRTYRYDSSWEQSAAYLIDTHPATLTFVKNAGLGFAIPYVHNGQTHEYIPDFIIRIKGDSDQYLIAETKGFDELEEVKREAAERWVRAVNVEGSFGRWRYRVAKQVSEIPRLISSAAGA